MTQAEIISAMEAKASQLGVPMYQVCAQAKVAPSTFYRWKDGSGATFTKIDLINAELARIEKKQAQAARKMTK